MSLKASSWAMDQHPKTSLQKLVLIILSDCHNESSGKCFPGIELICTRAMCARSSVFEALRALEKQGFIEIEKSQGRVNHYRLSIENQSGDATRPAALPVQETDGTRPDAGLNPSGSRTLTGNNSNLTGRGISEPPEQKTCLTPGEFKQAWNTAFADEPGVTKVRSMTSDRVRALKARIKENPEQRSSADHWRKIFEECRRSEWMMGRKPPSPGKTEPFRLDVDWLLEERNLNKTLEGKYHHG